jgi:hypothetical protein
MRLSLNETWKLCRKMWKGVLAIRALAQEQEDITIPVYLAKEIWLQQHGYKKGILNNCFFCEYVSESGAMNSFIKDPDLRGGCPECPGTKVDPDFACQVDEYHWAEEPEAFTAKIRSLDRKRRRIAKKD